MIAVLRDLVAWHGTYEGLYVHCLLVGLLFSALGIVWVSAVGQEGLAEKELDPDKANDWLGYAAHNRVVMGRLVLGAYVLLPSTILSFVRVLSP